MSLKTLAGIFLVAILAAAAATAAGTLFATDQAIVRFVDQRIVDESESIVEPGQSYSEATLISRIKDASQRRESGDIGFLLSRENGQVVAGNVFALRKLPDGFSDLNSDDGIEGLTHGRALVRPVGGGLRLVVLAETEPIQNLNSTRVQIVITGFGAIILIVVTGLIIFARIIRRKVSEMRKTVDAIIDGDMLQRVPIDGSNSELDQQAIAFNRMLDRISALMTSISHVSHDIAHDMRTPLSRLRVSLAALKHETQLDTMYERLDDAIAETDSILALFRSILRIAEVETGGRRAGFSDFDLTELLCETAALCEPLVEEEDHAIAVRDMATMPVRGDRRLLMQVLINLIENAIRHTPAGTRIITALERSGADVILTVEDNGPGIPASMHADTIRRFGRLDKSRGRPGHGLGLALVDSVVRMHGGEVVLADAQPGLRVILKMPIVTPSIVNR